MRRFVNHFLMVMLLPWGLWADAQGDLPKRYQITSASLPNGYWTQLSGINDSGVYVGWTQDPNELDHAIYFDGIQLQLIDPSGSIGRAHSSQAFAISSRGEIGGTYEDDLGVHGFLYNPDGKIATLDYPGGVDTEVNGVNKWGTAVGTYYDASQLSHAFIYRDGGFLSADLPGMNSTTPSGINDSGFVVGSTSDASGTYGYIQDPKGIYTLYSDPRMAATYTVFTQINNQHQILGYSSLSSFVKTGPIFRPLPDLAFRSESSGDIDYCMSSGFNSSGVLVGWYEDFQIGIQGCIATPVK